MQTLRFQTFGPPGEVLEFSDFELPPLSDGEVRLRMLASPLNPADLNLIEGTYGVRPDLPAVPGIEGCGEVEESRSPDFEAGDRCMFVKRAGLWASHVQVPAGHLLKLPGGLDPQQAAMLKVNPATAWRLLKGFVDLPRGSWVVQNAANSGVGRAVIQLARSMGVRTVNLVRRQELIPQLLVAGADHVLLDDGDAAESVADICGPVPPLLALNAVGGDSALRLMNCLAAGGTHVTYGAMARRPLKVPNGLLIFKDLRITGFWLTRWLDAAPRDEVEEVYVGLAEAAKSGALRIPVDSSFALEDFRDALVRLEDPERNGKVLFRLG